MLGEKSSISVDGIERNAWVHLPKEAKGKKALPVVLVFHGAGQDAANIAEISNFNDLSDKKGFIAVFPEGVNHRWNDGRVVEGEDNAKLVDDVAYVSSLVNELANKWHGDRSRVYATGFSNGGMFCQKLGCALPDRIAAIAPVAASMSVAQFKDAHAKGPMSVCMFFGTMDKIEPWAGGDVVFAGKKYGQTVAIDDVIQFWVKNDHCGVSPKKTKVKTAGDKDMLVERQVYRSKKPAATVTLYKIEGGGHTWPGNRSNLTTDMTIFGKTSSLQATELIWDFFEGCRKQL